MADGMQPITILEAMVTLFATTFGDGTTWAAWLACLAAMFGLPMTPAQLATYQACTGRTTAPVTAAVEAMLICGRRAGKSIIAALIAVFLAVFRDYEHLLAPGERGVVMVLASDRKQAGTVFRYIAALLEGVPMLRKLIVRQTDESIELANRIVLEVHTSSFRSVRGFTVVGAVLDELAFWRSEDSANPDREIVAALKPAMSTIPGALLVGISSPYSRRGVLWDAYRRHFAKDGDVLVWQAPTRTMNPLVPQAVIDAALAEDEVAARAEYGAEFRNDLEQFVSLEIVEGATVPGRFGLPPVQGTAYVGFTDPSGGSADAFTLAIAHSEERDGTRIAVVDYLSERKPPFSPEAVVDEFATALRSYGVTRVQADRYAGAWVVEAFGKHNVTCAQSAEPKSALYANLLPFLNSGRVELLDHRGLRAQLLGLERRTARGGRDTIDHGPNGHDDLVNSVAGAVGLLLGQREDGFYGYLRLMATEAEQRAHGAVPVVAAPVAAPVPAVEVPVLVDERAVLEDRLQKLETQERRIRRAAGMRY